MHIYLGYFQYILLFHFIFNFWECLLKLMENEAEPTLGK